MLEYVAKQKISGINFEAFKVQNKHENKEWHVGFLGGVYSLVKQVTISHVVKNRCKCTIQRYVGDCLSLYLVVTWEHFTRS